MRDLYTIFTDVERRSRVDLHPEFEDTSLPFHKILEIAEQEDDSDYDDE